MTRVPAAVLALVATALVVIAALLPEYVVADTIEVAPLDSDRPGWLAALVGLLVHAALLLVAALMLLLRESPGVAGGLLVGASVLGLSIRATRLFQLASTPDLSSAVGSWVDLGAEAVALTAGVLALFSLRSHPAQELTEPTPAPPPGEPTRPPG